MKDKRNKISEVYEVNSPNNAPKKKYALRTDSDELVSRCQDCQSSFRTLPILADILPAIRRDSAGDLYCTMFSITCPTLIGEEAKTAYQSGLEEAATPNANFKIEPNRENINYKKNIDHKKLCE